ncbi:MAG: porin family protein [Paludibacteraceae bacterium]|nr:porin family protein [Paludibacteraceae bacterium]
MKHLLPITFLLSALTFQTAFSQEWHFGPAASYVNTNIKVKSDSEKTEWRGVSGFQIGGFAGYDFIDYIGLQSGILFAMTGYEANNGVVYKQTAYTLAKEKTRLFNLMFPLYVIGKIPIGDFSINLEAGPQFYAGLAGRTTVTTIKEEEYTYSNIFDESLDRFNCDIHFGLGFQYTGARLTFGYNLGVYNVVAKEYKNDIDAKLSGFVVTFAYMF